MQKSDFRYHLPAGLIAQIPLPRRTDSRLLSLDGATGMLADLVFGDLPDLLQPGDLLVFNDTRVIPARVYGRKESGGRIEILVERVLDDHCVIAQVRASKSPKVGQRFHFNGDVRAHVASRLGEFWELEFKTTDPVLEVLNEIGRVPLPPYITRPDSARDKKRYQTVYAKRVGAVAAPTAGLHFDERMFARLRGRGVDIGFLTLHIGAGTFQPVRVPDIHRHRMHTEYVEVPPAVCDQVCQARTRGKRVVAVGTTSVRALETAAAAGGLEPFRGATDIFIYPGYRFRAVDALITNFHLPESTLLMLVYAFAGMENVLKAYRHAVQECYRFFSYGDAMFVTPQE